MNKNPKEKSPGIMSKRDGSAVDEKFRYLAAIVQSSEDTIIGKDLSGIITSWNPAAEKLFGYSEKEAIGLPISILGVPDRLDEFKEIIETVKKRQRVERYETRFDSNTTRRGLGLSTMRERTELSGGTCTIESVKGWEPRFGVPGL